MISLTESSYIKKALSQQQRLDGRSLNEIRQLYFEFGNDRGHVIVHLGQTKVLACVTAQVVRPFQDRPLEGILGIYVELSQVAMSAEDYQEKEDQGKLALSRLLERLFKSGRTVDTESLCIVPGEQVWSIRLDVRVLDDNGNVQDAAVLASLAAFLDFRRPDSTVIDGKAIVYSTFERNPVPLTLQYHPFSVTFGVFELAEAVSSSQRESCVGIALDLNALEEKVSSGKITLAMNRQGELVSVIKTSGLGLDPEVIHTDCLNIARKHAILLSDRINSELSSRK